MDQQTSKSLQETASANGKNFGGDKPGKQLSEGVESAYETARTTFADAGRKIADGYESAKEELGKAGSQLESVVKRNPLIAVACAAGAGWVVGRMLTSRSMKSI